MLLRRGTLLNSSVYVFTGSAAIMAAALAACASAPTNISFLPTAKIPLPQNSMAYHQLFMKWSNNMQRKEMLQWNTK